jgi:hypothetical protein
MINKFKIGDKVEVNGNKEAIILKHYDGSMYDVRLWSKFRHIGDITVPAKDIKLIKEREE